MPTDDDVFRRYLIDEFLEDYQTRRVSRRDTLKLLAGITGSLSIAGVLMAACAPTAPVPTAVAPTTPPAPTARPANTPIPDDQRVAANDPAIRAETVSFRSGADMITGYLARPAVGNGPFPAILECPANRGLTDHNMDVTRRLAKSGYVGLSLDLVSREGGTAKHDRTAIPGLLTQGGVARHVGDFKAAFDYLQGQSFVQKENIGMIGFCFGGGMTLATVLQVPGIKAAVPFYGPPPADFSNISKVNAAVLELVGDQDAIAQRLPDVEKQFKDAGKTFQYKVYPGAAHAFYDDQMENPPLQFNPPVAKQAWGDALAWLDKYLKA